MKPNSFSFCLLSAIALALPACAPATSMPPATAALTSALGMTPATTPAGGSSDLILATTTSTQDSGLLDVLMPLFEQRTGLKVKVVAVGTGQALQMGQQGNADVLLVHAPSSEKTFMAGGFGKDRVLIMHNDFLIVGPPTDPAGIRGSTHAVDAFKKIGLTAALFASRGDQSGTNAKELSLWKSAGIDPAGTKAAWYLQTGQGMGATLTIASEKSAYTLTDRATYLANRANLKLDILAERDTSLLNVYHVITVNPDTWPKVNYTGALAFLKFMTDPATQAVIGKFGVDKYGQQLFVPDANKTEAELGLN